MIELNNIYNEDCIEFMKRIDDKSVEMVFCDSPYGQNIRNERGKIKFDTEWKDEDEFLNWCRQWLSESKRILKDDGMLLVWGVAPIINEISHILNKELDMKFYTQIIWHVSDGLRPTNNYFYSNHQVLLGYSKNEKDIFKTVVTSRSPTRRAWTPRRTSSTCPSAVSKRGSVTSTAS